MNGKKVVVTVNPDGSTHIDAQGFTGSSCQLATRELEMALVNGDASALDDKKKPDFYARTGQSTSNRNFN